MLLLKNEITEYKKYCTVCATSRLSNMEKGCFLVLKEGGASES